MDFRLAVIQDLPQIKSMYRDIIRKMEENQIAIWDEVYPCDFFEEDIRENRLYLMLEGSEIVSAFALCGSSSGESRMDWEHPSGKALYLDRLGVHAGYQGKGVGGLALTKAKETARALGAEYLRLFVVDSNAPAIRLYSKNGFSRAPGIYYEVIDETCTLREYGFEAKL